MYLSARLTQTISRHLDTNIASALTRLQGFSACAGIPEQNRKATSDISGKKNAAEKARINHHGTMHIPPRRFIFAPVGGWGEDVVPPEYYRELRALIKELFERGAPRQHYVNAGISTQGARPVKKYYTRSSPFGMARPGSPYLDDRMTGRQVLQKIADKMAELQIRYIEERHVAPNKESTIAIKRSKKIVPPDLPLFETGELKRSIKGWVDNGKS